MKVDSKSKIARDDWSIFFLLFEEQFSHQFLSILAAIMTSKNRRKEEKEIKKNYHGKMSHMVNNLACARRRNCGHMINSFSSFLLANLQPSIKSKGKRNFRTYSFPLSLSYSAKTQERARKEDKCKRQASWSIFTR